MESKSELVRIKQAIISDSEISINICNLFISYCFFWFRDNCRCEKCYNHETHQRVNDLLDISDSEPKKLEVKDNNLIIHWDDGHQSVYSADFLWKCWPGNWKQKFMKKILWSGDEIKDKVAYVKRDEFLNSEDAYKKFLQSLVTYGIAFVDEVENSAEDTERVIRRVGPIMQTLFGGLWSFTSDMARADTAYTNIPLGPHTDGTYLEDAAGLQILHCLEHTGTGGENFLLDGFFGAQRLKEKDERAFKILSETFQPADYLESGWHHSYTAPVININPVNGEVEKIRFNTYDRNSNAVGSAKETKEYYAALKALARLYTSKELQWHFKLNPGRVVFFDNWRVLHGREGFTGRRVIGGAYIARRDWLSAARVRNLI